MFAYQKFAKLLIAKNVTSYKVAKDTGTNPTTISAWKKGIYVPKVDKLQKFADYFGVPVSYFLK